MEGLKTLIRNLAFILLLASFLEMLLPNKSMRGFVQLVMGLFVIAAVLNPLADFLSLDLHSEIPAWVNVSSTDLPVLAAEGTSVDTGKSAVREQYRRILISQIKVLVSAIEGVKSYEVDVELDQEAGGFSDYPQILQVSILFSQSRDTVRPVNPVVIGEDSGQDERLAETDKAAEIRKQVSALMQIPDEIVSVVEKV
jgi:stage III sporulation protein AF